ncbi:hypothetical protein K678_15736 [Magnetospirillum fulvum MGU-K5]|uniref:UDP-N-acetylglucosamine 2-epimerase n=2 Tax=Magnetospirillum fulvum TaxID=1082 RepID=S9S3K1_MAGFU|nr:hypothetical protein K678_15736 [Magnetospirillum fulvum MGU-K5]
MCSWDEHIANTRALFAAMSDTGAEVLLSLHPKSRPETYRDEADIVGAHILVEPLRDVLPLADIFVSTYSSTVRWAAMLGIATIIADFTGLNYRMYDHLTSLSVVRDQADLKKVLTSLVRDDTSRGAVAAALREDASLIGVLDGQACRRIYAIALSLCGQVQE